MHELINKTISEDEICIRCLLSPLYCSSSKQKLKEHALLPPPNSDEVSLLRLMYANLDWCKLHAKYLEEKMNNNNHNQYDYKYQGLAAITSMDVNKVNLETNMSCKIVYAPMDDNEQYIPKDQDVYSDEKGLPMHANLIYPFKIEKGELYTKARKYAKKLIKVAKFKYDEHPESLTWDMGSF